MSIHNELVKGFGLLNSNSFKDALNIANSILAKKYNLDALMLAGIASFKLKKYNQAEIFFSKLYKEQKQHKVTLVYYLETLIKQEKTHDGIKVFEQILDKDQAMLSLGINLYELNGDFTKAIELAKKLISGINKTEILAWNYERTNQLEKAISHSNEGLLIDSTNFKCNITIVKILLRNNKPKKAIKRLKNIQTKQLSLTNLSIYYSLKAQILEQQQKFKKAFKAYTKSNNALKRTAKYKELKGYSYYTIEKVELIKNYFNKNIKFNNILPCKEKIVFMVGYPRSGTTLLENILNSHTEIHTIEEKPTVDTILERFLINSDSIKALENLNDNEIVELQEGYINARNKYSSISSKIIIDKMPLNLIHIGILYRIFPNAKFIISTRDIRDVALSCFFQNFAINDAMANFLDWDKTKDYLQAVMGLCNSIVSSYPINVNYVEYESFVDNPIATTKEIIDFLGLEWQETIKDYRKQIIGKNINTPSYATVSNAITNSKKNRWKNYKNKF